jgi:drug/metabolite transporter (DMT)-like permease
MVKQRFRVLFRRWFFTVAKVCGPILLFELFVMVRQHFQNVPPSISDLLMGAFLAFLLTGLLCWLWALGEWLWSRLRRLRGLLSEPQQCSRSYWNPGAVRTNKA